MKHACNGDFGIVGGIFGREGSPDKLPRSALSASLGVSFLNGAVFDPLLVDAGHLNDLAVPLFAWIWETCFFSALTLLAACEAGDDAGLSKLIVPQPEKQAAKTAKASTTAAIFTILFIH